MKYFSKKCIVHLKELCRGRLALRMTFNSYLYRTTVVGNSTILRKRPRWQTHQHFESCTEEDRNRNIINEKRENTWAED